MQDMLTTRKEMAASLLGFGEKELKRVATHPAYGEMTMIQWLHFFLLHESHHLFTIFKLAGTLRKS